MESSGNWGYFRWGANNSPSGYYNDYVSSIPLSTVHPILMPSVSGIGHNGATERFAHLGVQRISQPDPSSSCY